MRSMVCLPGRSRNQEFPLAAGGDFRAPELTTEAGDGTESCGVAGSLSEGWCATQSRSNPSLTLKSLFQAHLQGKHAFLGERWTVLAHPDARIPPFVSVIPYAR